MKIKDILNKENWLLIAKTYGRNDVGASELAEKLGVSKQRIQQVAVILRKEGVEIPHCRNKKGHVKEFISFVKEHLND